MQGSVPSTLSPFETTDPQAAQSAQKTSPNVHVTPIQKPIEVTSNPKISRAPSIVSQSTRSHSLVAEPPVAPENLIEKPEQTINRPVDNPVADTSPLTKSKRPKARLETDLRQSRSVPLPKSNSGNARQSAAAGTSAGTNEGRAVSQGQEGQQQEVGNAAADNYPGLVMRCISKAGRPRVDARGNAIVAFSVDQNGHVASPHVVHSSGNHRFDRAAVATVRNAGPCPKPPSRAQTRFRIRFEGR